MQLREYQQQALQQLSVWLDALREARTKNEQAIKLLAGQGMDIPEQLKDFPRAAWKTLSDQKLLPRFTNKDGEEQIPEYIPRTADSGDPIPHVCMRIPTGGGKTILGVTALGYLKQERGLVLWIVPTKAIYEQTLKAFKNREHPYREALERISGRKIKLLQKDDRFTKQDSENYLCLMLIMLPSANRNKNKEFLKIFRDSGGYTSFFPDQDDLPANRALTEQQKDLEKSDNGAWVKHSLINVFKMTRPTVILDEAHRAYGKNNAANQEFVRAVNRLNPSLVLELSATPELGISNILVNVSGTALQAEEMIKLPIEIHTLGNSDWKATLAKAQEKLTELSKQAERLRTREGRYIRPIVLVRVQRTGKETRETRFIHADDAREYLIKNLAVRPQHIRVQSSEQKELAGEDLLAETSEVRWIITKDALKEGWDCSFAYILALLDNTTATTAMTQMTGRVMRQPHGQAVAGFDALNKCYVYCYNQEVEQVIETIRRSLKEEGLADLSGFVHGQGDGVKTEVTPVRWRAKYRKLKIFLPQVLHKKGKEWRLIDYESDILHALDWRNINMQEAVELDDTDPMQETVAAIDLEDAQYTPDEQLDVDDELSVDYFVRRLIDTVPNAWQAAQITENLLAKYNRQDKRRLLNNRRRLSEELRKLLAKEIDAAAERVFRNKLKTGEIKFHLQADKRLDYDLNRAFEISVTKDARDLRRGPGKPLQLSLFEPIFEGDFNRLEKDFALYLDKSKAVHWWHRIVAKQDYALQGWRRHRIYPDFVICKESDGKLLILETKGIHLKGNEDTDYKEMLLKTLTEAYENAYDGGSMEAGEPRATYKMLFEDEWKQDINELLRDDTPTA